MKNSKRPRVNVDILVVRGKEILLGLLTDKWDYKGKSVWGVPGRDILFGEKIGETVKRNILEEFGCKVTKYRIFCVNSNYALGNHYIGIGVVAEIDGEPTVRIREDWVEWRWFEMNKIPDNLFPATKHLIDCYIGKKFTVSD